MGYSYDKRRAAPTKNETLKPASFIPMGSFLPGVSNSAQIAMMGYRDDTSGGLADLKAAMNEKASSILQGQGTKFGPDYENKQAEAEADRIGSRFSTASSEEELKSMMGSALGADFSDVRFHTGAGAAAMAASADARAFTTGRDIYMGSFNAGTAAHEMVHTIQQGAVEASSPVLSAPAGSVQYDHNPLHWIKKKTVGAHREALDQFIDHREDYDKMSHKDRALWTLKNPLARIRGRSAVASQNEGHKERKRLKDQEDARAAGLSALWKQQGHYTDDIMGDANTEAQLPDDTGEYEFGKVGQGVEKVTGAIDAVNGDLGSGTGLSVTGTPFEAAGIADSATKIKSFKELLKKKPASSISSDDLAGLKGMDAANAVAGGLGAIADTAGFVSDAMDAHKQRMQGNHWAAVGSSINAAADAAAVVGDVVGAIPVGPCGVIGSGFSGVSNSLKAGVSIGSAIGNGVTQHKMRKRNEGTDAQHPGYKAQLSALEAEDLSGKSASEKAAHQAQVRELRRKSRTVEQARKAGRIRKNSDIVSGVSSTVKAAGNFTAMGLGTAALVGSFGVLDPVSGIVNSIGTGASAATEGIGNQVIKHQKRKMRKETVNEEISLDEKIQELRSGNDPKMLAALGMTKAQVQGLSESDAKHIILKSMGFKSGKRKEAFNQITMRRASALAEKANADDQSDEAGIVKDMFLGKDSSGHYNVAAIAEKLGLEEMEDPEDMENPFAKKAAKAEAKRARRAARTTPTQAPPASAGTTPSTSPGATPTQTTPLVPTRPAPPVPTRPAPPVPTRPAPPVPTRPAPPVPRRPRTH